MTRAEIESLIAGMEKKYFDLVWLVRKRPSDKVGNDGVARVEREYPEEIARLKDPDDGKWEHGFNSGCLAAFRLVLGIMGTDADATQAQDAFPFLDT